MELNNYQKICLGFFLILTVYWSTLFFLDIKAGFHNYFYSFLFGLIPFFAGIIAMYRSQFWGGFSSSIGKAVFFIGFGIFLWGTGENIWSYYNFYLHIPAPYPSLADLGFAPSIFFYGLGAFYLSDATGAKFGFRSMYAKILVTITTLIVFLISYYLLIEVARGGVIVPPGETPLKILLDISYPLGGFISLILAVVISGLSFKYLGGKYKIDIYSILLGLAVMFVADIIFSYTTTTGTYYNASPGDLLLSTGTFLLSFGVLGFYKLKTE